MRVLVSGGSGLVGRYIVEGLAAAGQEVVIGSRTPDLLITDEAFSATTLDLDPRKDQRAAFAGVDIFVHAAFHHVAGKYRGGEGNDPAAFRLRNLDGSIRLFEQAKAAGVRRCIFLSSRAVYGDYPAGTPLKEDLEPKPDTLYGEVKLQAEHALLALHTAAFQPIVLRATGVYGARPPSKWDDLVRSSVAGITPASRRATEVHGRDLASAVGLACAGAFDTSEQPVFNLSDILVDHRDIIEVVRDETGLPISLPERSVQLVSAMDTTRARSLGWQPGGWPLFEASIRALVRRIRAASG